MNTKTLHLPSPKQRRRSASAGHAFGRIAVSCMIRAAWVLLLIAHVQIVQPLSAATFYWDSDADATGNLVDGTNLGGTGTWDLSTANWWDTAGMVVWPDTTADTAIFSGTAGIVTLGVPLNVGTLQFDSDGYQITGGTLTLGGAATINVTSGNHAGVLSDIAGSSGLVKTGAGTLNLGPSNSFIGSTVINGGVVEVYKDESLGSGNGALILDGGTLSALGNNFYSTRNVVVNAGGGTLNVSRDNSNWGSLRLKGSISGSGTLTKTGFGQLRLDGDSSGFTGTFVLDQGVVRLNGYSDRGTVINDMPSLGASRYDIHAGGDLWLHYASLGTTPYYSAINETAPIHMEGGRIFYLSNNSGAVSPWTQNLGDLFLDGGSNRFLVQRQSAGSATLMSFGNLTHAAGSTADFRAQDNAGALLTSIGTLGNQPLIKFANNPVANDGVLGGWATFNLNDFADYDPTFGVRVANYTSTDITTAGPTDNVDMTGAGGVIATIGDTTVNSIKWTATASTSTIQQDPGTTLTIDTGGLLVLGNFNKRIQASSGDATIKANGGALYIHNNQLTLTIDSIIADGDMATALVKSQYGSLTLNGANTYTGGTYHNGGGNITTGNTAGVTYLGTGAVYVTGGNLVQSRPGATSFTMGYFASEGGTIFVNTTQAFTLDGDRYTIAADGGIGGPSGSGTGLNSLTYVTGPVAAGGEVYLAPGAVVMHSSNSASMGTGTNTIQGLPNDMSFYFGDSTTQSAASGVTIGVGTPWKGLSTDRNTRGWDQGTITVNGSDFELRGLLAPNATGEGQSAYVLRLGNDTAGVAVAGFPTITGAPNTPLNAHVTGGYLELMDDSAVYGDTSPGGSPLTFLVEAGAGLQISATNAMGSGNGLATIQVRDGDTLQQYYSTSNATANAISAASASGINGNVTIQPRGRFLAQHNNGLTGTGTITFEPRSILQINNNTGWTGSQAEAAVGINNAIIRIQADNFGEASKPLLTNYGIDGTGIYEWATNANAANPSAPNTPTLSLNGGIVINDAFDRSFDLTTNGFIEILAGGGTLASTSGQLFNIQERVELHGNTLTIGYADVIDGDPGLGDLRLRNVTSDVPGGMINVISGAQARINLTNAIQDDITITLQAGAWLDVDNNDTILELIGNGATSRVLGDAYLTVTKAGDYDFNASLGDNARLTQAGGGILTIIQNADGNGVLGADGAGSVLKIGTGISIGTSYTLNPVNGGVIDLNGQTTSGASNVTGDSSGTIEIGNSVLLFDNAGTVTFNSTGAAITTNNGPGIIRLIGEGQVRFDNDPTRLNMNQPGSQIDIFNGEFRVDGRVGTIAPDPAPTASTFVIDVPTINLGDGLVTTGATGSQYFPRLYLVNTEATQTAALNVNGGWITSDLGNNDINIWSGPINFTGAANTNIFDVNDAGVADQHAVTGVIGGTGGFSKVNNGTLRLEADNTISGNIYIQRGGVGGTNIDSTLSRGGIRLTTATGALSAVNSVVISRDGSLYLNNATDVNSNRLNDTADLILRGQGRIRLIGNGTSAINEVLGDLHVETGSGKVNFDIDDTMPQLTTYSFTSFKRDPGSIAQFQVVDNLPGSFGSPFAASTKAQLFITDAGMTSGTVQVYGGDGANSSTNKTVVVGAFGGVNDLSNHFMTFDSVNTTELRPLVWDGTPVGSEYFLSREAATLEAPHQFTRTGLVTNDQNVLINYNTDFEAGMISVLNADDPPAEKGKIIPAGLGGGYGWFGNAPVAILENVAMNSLRFGTNTPTVNVVNSGSAQNVSNEIGSALVLAPGARLYLGDKAADAFLPAITASGSGMILFGRDITGSSPGSNQYIAGGYLDFGTREAILVNESGNSAFLRSNIVGNGGLTKAGANTIYLDNSNSYYGDTNIAEGILVVRDQNALGNTNLVKIEGAGQLYLELGTQVQSKAAGGTPPALYIGVVDASRNHLFSNSSNNTWGGDVIVDNVDNLGNMLYDTRIGVNVRDTLNINGNIYGNELGSPTFGIAANPINTDTALNDARYVTTNGSSSSGGIINIFGKFMDNVNGAIATPVTSENENQLLRFFIRGSNELVVNAKQQWGAAGLIFVENGILRYEGTGNFWDVDAAANMNSTNSQSGLRIGGNSNAFNAAVVLTKPGQVLNIGRIDIGGDGTNNYNALGNDMLAGTNSTGTVTFGDGTETIRYNGSSTANNFVRDLTAYEIGGGTMELNFRLDDTDGDSHTSFTKIGRGVVNFNGQNDVNGAAQNGDVEQLNMSGGLLRLTNYGHATGRRFDTGAMITFAGGGLEMDGASSIQNETANYTGAAVGTGSNFPTAQTLIAAGGTDVIVTSKAGRTTTMNIGSTTLATNRQTGGTLNFVENGNGGTAAITFEGSGGGSIQAVGTPYAWATYGDTYTYNAAAATYTVNALDFAMTTGANGAIEIFSGATREDADDVTAWTAGSNVSESVAGFNGGLAAVSVNTLHFDFDGAGSIDATNGLEVTSGGIMVSSTVLTGGKSINNGTLNAGADLDLIIHQYGGVAMTVSSVIQDHLGSTAGNALVKAGGGELILTADNTYTGGTYLNGGQVTISSNTNLGATPAAVDDDNIYANGGTLRVLSDVVLDANRGMMLGGNGVEISVGPDSTLTYNGLISSEPNVIANYSANPAVGRVDKTGLGTLLITEQQNTYTGLTEVVSGTLKFETLTNAGQNTTFNPFGSTFSYLDGTVVRSGATLAIHPTTAATNTNRTFIMNEWFTFEGGSTLDIAPVNNATTPHDFNLFLRGVLNFDSLGNPGTPDGFVTPTSLAGATVIDVGQRSTNLNDDGGYLIGDGGITKTGDSTLSFRENSPDWTGQLVVLQGQVYVYGAGDVLGRGTLPIILGHSLLAEQAGEVVSGNTAVQLFFYDEGGYRDVSRITQDIIVRNDDGAGAQTKQIGARYQANIDEVNFDGNITLRDDLQFFYQDDARGSTSTTSATNVTNSTRSIGTLGNQETVFINFNGNIIGAVGNDLTTVVTQGSTGNEVNGSDPTLGASGIGDDLVIRAVFGLNGDNSGWAGNLTVGNTDAGGDVDTQHIVTFGNPLAISANNNVTIRSDATLRTSGNDIVIGNLSPANANLNAFIENSSAASPGSITITQSTDASVDVVLRDGETVFILQPGQSYQPLSFTKAGLAVLELTKGNSFTGATTLAGGTLRLAYDADNSMLSDTSALILNDGILDLAGTVPHSELVASTTINGTVAIERSTGTSIINLETITRNAGSLRIGADDIATTDNANVNGILGGWATVGGNFATNSGVLEPINGYGNFIRGLTAFDQTVNRLGTGNTIANGSTDNVTIVEAGAGGTITLATGGITTINTLRQGADGSTVDGPNGAAVIDIGGGNTLRIASGGVLLPDGSSSLVFTPTGGTLTAGTGSGGTLFLHSQGTDTDPDTAPILTIGTVIADDGGIVDVRTTGPGFTLFTGANTYTGETLVGSGTLAVGDGGTSGTLGSGGVKVEASAVLAFNRSDDLTVQGELNGNGTVEQNGPGSTTLNTATTQPGGNSLTFYMADGTLVAGVDNAIHTSGTLYFGTTPGATTTSTLDLTTGSTILGGLIVQTNLNDTDPNKANEIKVGADKTLTINGAVTVGTDGVAGSDTVLKATGGGNIVVNSGGANFQVGGATGGANFNKAALDLSGLANFTADLGAGLFRIGDDNTPTNNNPSSAALATNNTITAGAIMVGDGSGGVSSHTLTLGSGTNVIHSDIINIGSAVNRGRSGGEILFAAEDTTGSVTIRGTDGVTSTTLNMINTTNTTSGSMDSKLTLTNHTADIKVGLLTMANRPGGSGSATAELTFNQGILVIDGLIMAARPGSGNGNADATLNLGDSAAPGTPTTTIGVVEMGVNTSSGSSVVTADINITGGDVTIGTGSGTAINMANAGTGRTVNSTIDLTGGTTTVNGNIIRTGGAGTENATITLDGGVLNMSGNSIGTGAAAIAFVAASGTLSHLNELNGGGGLTKTTNGRLLMDGVNTYTGVTTVDVDGGILQFARQTAFYNNTAASWTATNLVVNSGGTAAFKVGGAGEFTAADIDIIKDLGTATGGFLGGATLGIDTSNATGTFTYASVIADTDSGNNSIGLHKFGTGTLELTGVNTYTGKTTVSGGTLSISADQNLGTAPGGPVGDQLTLDGGTLRITADATLAANRGITIGSGGGTVETAAATTTTISSVITGGGVLTKTGDGTVLLMNVNTNTGATNVNAGTLGGTGTVGGGLNVNAGGTVAPGVATEGLLTIGGDLNVGAGGTLLMQLGGATLNDESSIRGNENNLSAISGATIASWASANTVSLHDRLFSNDASAPVIDGVLKIDSAFLNGYAPVYGDVFDLLDWTTLTNGITGTTNFDFTGVVLDGDLMFNTQLFASNGIIVVVPEPSRVLLFMLGLAGLVLRRRRK